MTQNYLLSEINYAFTKLAGAVVVSSAHKLN